jgi:ketopantoate reductase
VALMQAVLPAVLATLPVRAATGMLDLARRGRLNGLGIRGSTWQSLARGRPTEIAYLNGEIVRLGRKHGIATPINEHLVDLIHEVERTGVFFPPETLQAPAVAAALGHAGGGP